MWHQMLRKFAESRHFLVSALKCQLLYGRVSAQSGAKLLMGKSFLFYFLFFMGKIIERSFDDVERDIKGIPFHYHMMGIKFMLMQ
jgi:hypothetical protein